MFRLVDRCKIFSRSCLSMSPLHIYPRFNTYLLIVLDSSLVSRHHSSSKTLNELDSSSEQNPGSQGWLPLAMTDAALFHLILGGTLLFDNVHEGRLGSKETYKHMNEAVHLLSTRLQNSTPLISDSTIVAVGHLADYEAGIPSRSGSTS